MANSLADAIAAGNDQWFNASRGPKPYIGKSSYTGLNLAKFKFEDSTFDGVHFSKCRFEDLINVRFTRCVFDQCVFINSNAKKKDASFENLVFHDCNIKQSRLSLVVKDLIMVKTTFRRVDFKDSIFFGLLRVQNCNGFSQSANLRYSDRKVEEVIYEGNDLPWYWKLTSWEGLRFILSIPIAKISWLLFIVHSAILWFAYATVRTAESLGSITTRLYPDAAKYISVIRPWITENGLLQSVSQNILVSLVLICGSILFNYACPKEIKGYDRQQWVYEINQNGYIYEHISYLRGFSRFIAFLFLLIAFIFLAYKYAQPVGTTVFRLAELAISVQHHGEAAPADVTDHKT